MSVPNIMRGICFIILAIGCILLNNLIDNPVYATGLRWLVEVVGLLLVLWAGAGLHAASVSEKTEEKAKR